MALRFGYFDSEITGTDEEGMPIFDRAETSDLFRLFFSKLVRNGVIARPGDSFQVVSGTGLALTVKPGFGMIQGAFAYSSTEETVTLPPASSANPRIDRVVLRLNYTDRLCELDVVTGTPAGSPIAPALTRDASAYEIGLAMILVNKNATSISQSVITDTRASEDVCGYIVQLIDTVDFDSFAAQFREWQAEEQQRVIDWIATLQGLIDDDPLASLLAAITEIQGEIEEMDAVVSNIADYVVEHDSNGYWTWWKYNSGRVVLHYLRNQTGTMTLESSTVIDGLKYYNQTHSLPFPCKRVRGTGGTSVNRYNWMTFAGSAAADTLSTELVSALFMIIGSGSISVDGSKQTMILEGRWK